MTRRQLIATIVVVVALGMTAVVIAYGMSMILGDRAISTGAPSGRAALNANNS